MTSLPDFGSVKVLVAGDVMLDRYWFGDAERISPEAPVPVVKVNTIETRAGGAANVAANLTAVGAQCRLISILGNDEAGEELAGICQKANVKCDFVYDSSTATTSKLRVVSRNQQLLRADFENNPVDSSLDKFLDHFQNVIDQFDVVVLSDYGKGSLARIESMITMAVDAKKPVVVDPKGNDFSRYRNASYITPNQKEFEAVAGVAANDDEFAEKAFSLVNELLLKNLLVTRSGQGMTVFGRDGSKLHSPANAREVYDVSGAGDTVVAVVAACVGAGVVDKTMLQIANAAAGIVVRKFGTAVAARQELEQVLKGAGT